MPIKVSEVAEFGAVLAEIEKSPEKVGVLARRLIDLSTELYALYLRECNEPIVDMREHQARVIWLQRRVRFTLRDKPVTVKFNSDPRGAAVKLVLPSGRADDFGGEGYCVPTVSRSE